MDTPSEAIPLRPEYRLFDAGNVGLAAFICCPLGGAILIAVNYFRLGKAFRGTLAVIVGSIGIALSSLLKLTWPTASGSSDRLKYDAVAILFAAVMWFCTWTIAKQEQGGAIREHTMRGGQLGSDWTAGWVGVATLVGLLIAGASAMYVYQQHKVVMIGTKDQVIYSGLATRSDATALGDFLKHNQYFLDAGAAVLVKKGIGGKTISFALQDGIWDEAGMLSKFEELSREAAPTVGGLPVDVQLVNSKGHVEMTSRVGEVHLSGGDAVIYEGSATESEAQALGERLQSKGFFQGRGANVILTRHEDESTTLTLVLGNEAWNNPAKVSGFEGIARDVAPLIGGLPINMHLVDVHLELKKKEVIEQTE
jgi:hypothetical protein